MVGRGGADPPISEEVGFTARCSCRFATDPYSFYSGRTLLSASRIPVFIILSLSAIGNAPAQFWWTLSDSNRLPHACKACALPGELRAHRLTLCVKTDKAFATPNSVRVVMVIMTGPTFYPVFIYSFYNVRAIFRYSLSMG